MDEKRTNSTVRIAAVGAALVAAILILGTIWTGRSARKDTVDAVRSVSMLYMDELAGRRVQVVEDNLNENIRKYEATFGQITPRTPGNGNGPINFPIPQGQA